MNKPLISIVTPVFNGERYIGETIDSIIRQDMPIEYIIIDDGSDDYTGSVVADKLERYRGNGVVIKYFRQENAGEQQAVNTGMEMITGKYFMIVNADDPLEPLAVKELYQALENNTDYVAVYPDWMIIDENSELVKYMECPDWDMKRMVREHRCIPSVGVMYRSEIIDIVGYRDPQFIYIGDFDYFYRVGLVGDYLHLQSYLANWRRYLEQMTAVDNPARAEQRKLLIDKFYSLLGSESYINVKEEAYAWAYLVAATESRQLNRKIKYIGEAIKVFPSILFTMHFWNSLYSYAKYYFKVRF